MISEKMQGTSPEIEQIVRLVLDRLQASGLTALPRATDLKSADGAAPDWVVSAAPPAASRPAGTVPPVSHGSTGVLRLDHRLVTLSCIENRLDGVATLEVPAKAVITPAVHDELRLRKIRLEHRSLVASSPKSMDDNRLMILVDGSLDLAGSLEANGGCPGRVMTSTNNCLADAARIATHLGNGGKFAVWSTARPFAAVLIGAKNRSLRCVHLPCPADLSRAQAQAEPNVFIVDAQTWEPGQISELGSRLLAASESGAAR